MRDIAEMLKVKMPSVTSAVKQLADMGLVEYTQYAPRQADSQGRGIAGKIIVSHGILFDFLREELALPEERANEVACQIEHIMTLRRLKNSGPAGSALLRWRGKFRQVAWLRALLWEAEDMDGRATFRKEGKGRKR
ncbi:MAG: metal-dependent transcriptional regulator [Akkermansia sp.]